MAEHSIHCRQHTLQTLYTVHSIYCRHYILYIVYTVHSIYCAKVLVIAVCYHNAVTTAAAGAGESLFRFSYTRQKWNYVS
jgi:hypothetical protein